MMRVMITKINNFFYLDPGKAKDIESGSCVDSPSQDFYVNMTASDGKIESVKLNDSKYGLVYKKPCRYIIRLESEIYQDDQWIFNEVLENLCIETSKNSMFVLEKCK